MLNRRLIRIKAFKTLFSYENSGAENPDRALKELLDSCEKSRDLYFFLLNVAGPLTEVARERIETGLRKFHPTDEEANPNYKFVNNRFTALVLDDPEVGRICQKKHLVWNEYDVFIKKLFASVQASDYDKAYMASGEDSFEEDCRLWQHIFEEEFEDNEMLEPLLEDLSVYWVDDVAFVLNVIIRNIDETDRTHRIVKPEVFQKEDDREFAVKLLQESISGYDEYVALISANLSNWEPDRLVSTDIALIVMGLAEAVTFSSIPVKVTINEYVEISKFYSTPNSRTFVNGMLDKLVRAKVESGEITKVGRGLEDN